MGRARVLYEADVGLLIDYRYDYSETPRRESWTTRGVYLCVYNGPRGKRGGSSGVVSRAVI